MSGIVRSRDELPAGTARLECVHCNRQWSVEQVTELGDPLRCPDCWKGGLVPRRHDRIADKYPGKLGEHFATIPHRLLDPNNSLELTSNELLVIVVLERFRWRWGDRVFPSQELIARMTRLSRRTVQRVLDGLVEDGLIFVEHDRGAGNLCRNVYDLTPLWDCLALGAPRPFDPFAKLTGVTATHHEAST